MSGKSLPLPSVAADEPGTRRPENACSRRFDPPSYYTTVHVSGYNVLTSIAAAKRRQARERKSQASRPAVSASSGEPHRNAVAQPDPQGAEPLSGRQKGNPAGY